MRLNYRFEGISNYMQNILKKILFKYNRVNGCKLRYSLRYNDGKVKRSILFLKE